MIETRYSYIVGKQSEIKRSVIDEMHSERKRCFIDELGWDLQEENGLEVDEYDHSQTEYVIVQEGGLHAASLRLHKNEISSSLMAAISKENFESNEVVWELSRFVSSNFSFSSTEYILITAAFCRLIELNVPMVYATLNTTTARLFRMTGINITLEESLPCKLDNCENYVIKTDKVAFEKFYRRLPSRDTAILRMLSPLHLPRSGDASLVRHPLLPAMR